MTDAPSVAIIGGGLAGMAAAVALATSGCRVELFESRRWLGGRAASFCDPETGQLVDLCQHVSMGCCTNLADFCRRIGAGDLLRRDRTLHFIGPDGQHCRLSATRWLPAPLHLAPGFWRMKYLSLADRARIGRAMWKLMRMRGEQRHDALDRPVARGERSVGDGDRALLERDLGEHARRGARSRVAGGGAQGAHRRLLVGPRGVGSRSPACRSTRSTADGSKNGSRQTTCKCT